MVISHKSSSYTGGIYRADTYRSSAARTKPATSNAIDSKGLPTKSSDGSEQRIAQWTPGDQVAISPSLREMAGTADAAREAGKRQNGSAQFGKGDAKPENELSAEETRQVEALRRRDQEVRAHEQAHLAAAGGFARGGAKYTFEVGPDGKRYAVGGEVSIDTGEVPGDPRATLQKAMTIRRAALAPADPSTTDRAVAAKAAAMAAKARHDILQENGQAPGDTAGAGSGDNATESGPKQTHKAKKDLSGAANIENAIAMYKDSDFISNYFVAIA